MGKSASAIYATLTVSLPAVALFLLVRRETRQISQMASDLIPAARSLALYGPETKEVRGFLHELVADLIDQTYSIRGNRGKLTKQGSSDLRSGTVGFYRMMRSLSPNTEDQKSLKDEALKRSFDVAEIRALTLAKESSSIPKLFLVVLAFWLVVLFAGFGLFAPPTFTSVVTLGIRALSASAALHLILDLNQPLTGLIQASIGPLRNAMTVIGR